MLEPGKCAAAFIEPPCDPFKVLQYDLDKWTSGRVLPKQILGKHLSKWKHAVLGAFGGRVFMAVNRKSINSVPLSHSHGLPDRSLIEALQMLYDLAALVELDVELQFMAADAPAVPASRARRCTREEFVFSTSSHPGYCDVSFPSGTRPRAKGLENATAHEDRIPYADKINSAFWRGSSWPAARCGNWSRSPRVTMVRASPNHGSVINASFSDLGCGQRGEPREMCRWLHTLRPQRVPPEEQLRYRFLPTSAPECTYTGRLQAFLLSNSVVAKFGQGAELAAQPLYGGLQDGVHLLLLRPDAWREQLEAAQGAWRSLAPLPGNARAYARWALSSEGQECYLYELLTGYARKLAYLPSEGGSLAGMLRGARTGLGHSEAAVGTFLERTTAEAVRFKGETYHLFTAQVAPGRSAAREAEAAMQARCAEFKARRPAEQVYSARQHGWVARR